MSLLNQLAIRQYVRDNHKNKGIRVSKEFYCQLESRLRLSINLAVELPCNRKTVRDLATGVKR